MSESIPLSFEAKDNLSQAVAQMTGYLERMGAVQDSTNKSGEESAVIVQAQSDAYKKLGQITGKILTEKEKLLANLDIEAVKLHESTLLRKQANIQDILAVKKVKELAALELELAGIEDEEVKARTRLIRTAQINNKLRDEEKELIEKREKVKLDAQLQKEEERAQKWATALTVAGGVAVSFAASAAAIVEIGLKSNEQWDIQSKKAGVSASSLGSIAEANAKLEKSQNKVFASVGKIIDRSSVFQSISLVSSEVLKDFNKWLEKNSEKIAEFGNNLIVHGAQKLQQLGIWISSNSETLARFQLYLAGVGKLVLATGLAVDSLAQALKIGLYGAIALTAGGLEALASGLITLVEMSGEEVPQGLEDLRLGLKALKEGSADTAVQGFDKLNESLDETAKVGMEAFDTVALAATGTTDDLKDQIGQWDKLGETIEGYGKKVEEAAKKGKKGPGKARGDLVDPEVAAEEKRQAALLDFDRQILEAEKAKDAILVAELTKQKQLVELGQSLKDIKTSTLRNATQSLESLRIQLEYEQSLKDVAEQKKADARAAYEIQDLEWRENLARQEQDDAKAAERYQAAMDRIQARKDAEIEAAQALSEAIEGGFGGLGDLLGEVSDRTSQIVSSLEMGVGAAARFGSSLKAVVVQNKSLKDSAEQVNAAILAGSQVASALVGGLVENAKTRAKIEAAINAAAAIATGAFGLATGNPAYFAAAAGHASAAVKYGLVASGVFEGGGSGSSGGGGSGATASPSLTQTVDLAKERALNAEAYAEALGGKEGGGNLTVNLSFDNALIASDSPQAAKILTDLIVPELQNVMRNN